MPIPATSWVGVPDGVDGDVSCYASTSISHAQGALICWICEVVVRSQDQEHCASIRALVRHQPPAIFQRMPGRDALVDAELVSFRILHDHEVAVVLRHRAKPVCTERCQRCRTGVDLDRAI